MFSYLQMMAVVIRHTMLSRSVQRTLCGPRLNLHKSIFNNALLLPKRKSHTVIDSQAGASCDLQNSCINLRISSWPQPLQLSHLWLRDHCRCSACYNHVTSQRVTDLLSIPSDIKPVKCCLEGNNLIVSWPDNHISTYAFDWLWKNSYHNYVAKLSLPTPVLWNRDSVASLVARVERKDFMNTDNGLKALVRSIIDFGVGIVENVPATLAATEETVLRVANVQHTLFGGMWNFSNAEMAHSDTAYTSEALGAHTDNTYFNEAAGLQIFHCFYHDGTGGENLLVDGFGAASDLQQKHPEYYKLLTSTLIESEYCEPGQHYSSTGPILRQHPTTQALQQVRFNLYDRAPMSALPAVAVPEFYEALKKFAAAIRDPKAEWWLKLKPGMVIFIDNWRVLHGRASYTGLRKMGGCYVNRSDFLSKARVLGML